MHWHWNHQKWVKPTNILQCIAVRNPYKGFLHFQLQRITLAFITGVTRWMNYWEFPLQDLKFKAFLNSMESNWMKQQREEFTGYQGKLLIMYAFRFYILVHNNGFNFPMQTSTDPFSSEEVSLLSVKGCKPWRCEVGCLLKNKTFNQPISDWRWYLVFLLVVRKLYQWELATNIDFYQSWKLPVSGENCF